MKITELHAGAIRIDDIDITALTDNQYEEIKKLLFKHLIVVIKTKETRAIYMTRIAAKIGEIENHPEMRWKEDGSWDNFDINPHFRSYRDPFKYDENGKYPVQRVTGEKINGRNMGIFQGSLLDWHCNLNNIHYADGVALQGARDVDGTTTSWMNTSLALKEMPADLYEKIKGKYALYRYTPESWGAEEDDYAIQFKEQARQSYAFWLEQINNAGIKGIYIHPFNSMQIQDDDGTLYKELYNYLFQEKFIYHHHWNVGDIVLSDQLLTQHKRQPSSREILEKRVLHRVTFNLSNQNRGVFVRNAKIQKYANGYLK